MYDALLSLRGWDEQTFRLADPRFLTVARWALFAEKVAPELEHAEKHQTEVKAALVLPPMDASPEVKKAYRNRRPELEASLAKTEKRIAEVERVLLPEDD